MISQNARTTGGSEKCLAFVIPLRHPEGRKVSDYRTIEALLERTVRSLLKQTHRKIAVVVVCHRVPDWAADLDDRVRFLDVSDDASFGADQHPTAVDKGLRYAIGTLYAAATFRPDLVALMDADDYIHVELAERLLSVHTANANIDGYIINRGVHLGVEVDEGHRIRYKFGVVVREFDFTCGSCRVFDAGRLVRRLLDIAPEIERRFSDWPEFDERMGLRVQNEPMHLLLSATEEDRNKENHIINLIGRHVKQQRYFEFRQVDFVAAAKSCGHGNHTGPRRGAVHWFRVVRRVPLRKCLSMFGLPPQRWSFDYLAMIGARAADKRAGNVWSDS